MPSTSSKADSAFNGERVETQPSDAVTTPLPHEEDLPPLLVTEEDEDESSSGQTFGDVNFFAALEEAMQDDDDYDGDSDESNSSDDDEPKTESIKKLQNELAAVDAAGIAATNTAELDAALDFTNSAVVLKDAHQAHESRMDAEGASLAVGRIADNDQVLLLGENSTVNILDAVTEVEEGETPVDHPDGSNFVCHLADLELAATTPLPEDDEVDSTETRSPDAIPPAIPGENFLPFTVGSVAGTTSFSIPTEGSNQDDWHDDEAPRKPGHYGATLKTTRPKWALVICAVSIGIFIIGVLVGGLRRGSGGKETSTTGVPLSTVRPTSLAPTMHPSLAPIEKVDDTTSETTPSPVVVSTSDPTHSPSIATTSDPTHSPSIATSDPTHSPVVTVIPDPTPAKCAIAGQRAQECGATNPARPQACCEGFVCTGKKNFQCISATQAETVPTKASTESTTSQPTDSTPTERPTLGTTSHASSSSSSGGLTYYPGHLTEMKLGVLLSEGLDIAIIAQTSKPVKFADGTKSKVSFHQVPDFGAAFPVPEGDIENPGGWVYVSNSESASDGGCGSIFFDRKGRVVDYKRTLTGTRRNCGGGRTPWGTWISCEEPMKTRDGQIYEVDPFGKVEGRKTTLGGSGGRYESFTYDIRDKDTPRFFFTEDHLFGAVRRFTPKNPDWEKTSEMLHGDGKTDYLVLDDSKEGTFKWVNDEQQGFKSANEHYPEVEGIDQADGQLFFVSKKRKRLYQLDLDKGTFTSQHTLNGAFTGGPDQLTRLIGQEDILYFTEDGGSAAGVHGRDAQGRFYKILESPVYEEETTGLAFSPDAMHMYLAYQKNGLLFDVWRKDGKPFGGRTIDIKYHNNWSV